MIRPCFSKLSSEVRTVFEGIAKPSPCEPPVVDAITVLMPITSPRRLISGPPLFPGLIAALVCSKSAKKSLRFGRPFELMIPSVTVSSNPSGLPIARTKSPGCTVSESASLSGLTPGSSFIREEKLKGIESVFSPNRDLLRRFDCHNRRDHAFDQRPPFPIQCLQRCDLF